MSEVRADNHTQNPPPAATPLYDADAPQSFSFNFQGRGKFAGFEYPVVITFRPMKDGDYIAYDKQRDVRMVGASDGVDASNETFGASLWLGRQLLQGVEGWGDPSGSDLSDERLADAVQGGLLACDIEPKGTPVPGDAAEHKPWEDDSAAEKPIKLRCIVEGRLVTIPHTPGEIEEKDLERLRKRYIRLKSRAKLVGDEQIGKNATKVPARAEAKGLLYDELGFRATGYAGRVPLHHKVTVVDDFFEVEQELVGKK